MTKLFSFVIILSLMLVGCRCIPSSTHQMDITINDSLYYKKITGDSLVKIPGSYVPLVVLPNDMKDGESVSKKEGQANIDIIKKGDTIFIEASCDSLELQINILEEELRKVKKVKDQSKEEIESPISRSEWFFKGFGVGILLIGIIWIINKIK